MKNKRKKESNEVGIARMNQMKNKEAFDNSYFGKRSFEQRLIKNGK